MFYAVSHECKRRYIAFKSRFSHQVADPLIPLRLLSAKGHARLTCSVANVLATVRCRYQPFAGAVSKSYNSTRTNEKR